MKGNSAVIKVRRMQKRHYQHSSSMSSFLSYLYKRPTAKRYRFAGYIAGHQDAITGVDFSNSGLLLASTGESFVRSDEE